MAVAGPSSSMTGGGGAAKLTDKDFEGKSQDEVEMMKVMGFGGFDSSKGKKVRFPIHG